MNGQDYFVTAIANNDRRLEEEVRKITGVDTDIGPIEGKLETTFVTQPGVNHSAGPVTHNNDEIHGTPTPTPHAAAGKEMSDPYSLHILLPKQRCYIMGRPEVRFFHQRESAPSTSEPATANVPIFEQLITLPSIGQPEASVPMTSTVHASGPILLTLEQPVTLRYPNPPGNPANTSASREYGNT